MSTNKDQASPATKPPDSTMPAPTTLSSTKDRPRSNTAGTNDSWETANPYTSGDIGQDEPPDTNKTESSLKKDAVKKVDRSKSMSELAAATPTLLNHEAHAVLEKDRSFSRGTRKSHSHRNNSKSPSRFFKRGRVAFDLDPQILSDGMRDMLLSSAPNGILHWPLVLVFAVRAHTWILGTSGRNVAIDYSHVVRMLRCFTCLKEDRNLITRFFKVQDSIGFESPNDMFVSMEPRIFGYENPRVLLMRTAETMPLIDRFNEDMSKRVPVTQRHFSGRVIGAIKIVSCIHHEEWSSSVLSMLMQILEQKHTSFCDPAKRQHRASMCDALLRCPWCPMEIRIQLKTVCSDCGFPRCIEDPKTIRHGAFLHVESYTDLGTENIGVEPWQTYSRPLGAKKTDYRPPHDFQMGIKAAFDGREFIMNTVTHLLIPKLGEHSWDYLGGTHWDSRDWIDLAQTANALREHQSNSKLVIRPVDVLQGWTDEALTHENAEIDSNDQKTYAELWDPHKDFWGKIRQRRQSALEENRWRSAADVPASIIRDSTMAKSRAGSSTGNFISRDQTLLGLSPSKNVESPRARYLDLGTSTHAVDSFRTKGPYYVAANGDVFTEDTESNNVGAEIVA